MNRPQFYARFAIFTALCLVSSMLAGCGGEPSTGVVETTLAQQAAPPSVAERDPSRLWCNEHDVYEDECVICHPEFATRVAPVTSRIRGDLDTLMCPEHGVLEHECGICHPEMLPLLSDGEEMKIRLSSGNSLSRAGVRVGYAVSEPVEISLVSFGEVSYNRNRLAVVTPLAEGVVRRIHVDVGDRVEDGDVLASVSSREVAEAKSAYVKALADYELRRQTLAREKSLLEQDVTTRQEYDEAHARAEASRSEVDRAGQALLNLGLTGAEADDVARTGSSSSELLVRAPLRGTIIDRQAVRGSAVDLTSEMFRVADLSSMWLELSAPEKGAPALAPGMQVRATFTALPGEVHEAEIT